MDKDQLFSNLESKINIKRINNMDIREDIKQYVATLIGTITETDVKNYRDQASSAEAYINSCIPMISEIPLSRIRQYIDFLASFSDNELRMDEFKNIVFYMSAKLSTELDEINTNWDSFDVKDLQLEISFNDYKQKYRSIINKLKNEPSCTELWYQDMRDLIFICYQIMFID